MNLELIEYVRKSLAKGNSIESIKKKLLETGWKPYQVDEVIKIVNSERGFEVEEKNKKARNIFLVFAGIVILLAIFLFIYLFSSSPRAISDSDLSRGIYLELSKGDSVEFNLEGKERILSIDDIGESNLIIIVGEPFVSLDLKINQTNHIDLTGDGVKDLKFILKNIERNRINLFVQAVEEDVCAEDWECTRWSSCINGYKGRVCLDNNLCGTTSEMPNEQMLCESFELNCEDQGGEICNSNSVCGGNWTAAPDSNWCCDGECSSSFIDCGTDWDCFINASTTCNLASLSNSTAGLDGLFNILYLETEMSYEIKGLDNNKCEFYFKRDDINAVYSDSMVQNLLGDGVTQEQINLVQKMLNKDYETNWIGRDATCKMDNSDLTTYLTKLKENNVSDWGVSCDGSTCTYTGDLAFFNDCEGGAVSSETIIHDNPSCGISSITSLAMTIKGESPGTEKLSLEFNQSWLNAIDAVNDSALSWVSENTSVVTLEPNEIMEGAVIATAVNVGSTNIIVTDTEVGSDCKVEIYVEVCDC